MANPSRGAPSSDFRVDVDWPNHPKTLMLQAECGGFAPFVLLRLWAFAARQRPDGVLDRLSREAVLLAIQLNPKQEESSKFLDTCIRIGFIDVREDGVLVLHDWQDWQPWVMRRQKRSAAGKAGAEKRWEGHKKQEDNGKRKKSALPPSHPNPLLSSNDESMALRAATHLWDQVREYNPKARKPRMAEWEVEMEPLVQDYGVEQVVEVIRFSYSHRFWRGKALNPSALARNWNGITGDMRAGESAGTDDGVTYLRD